MITVYRLPIKENKLPFSVYTYICIYIFIIYAAVSNRKRKPRRFSLISLLLVQMEVCHLSFCLRWNKRFANGPNGVISNSLKVSQKKVVWLCWRGWIQPVTHWREPTTSQHGNSWLLGFPPGPLRPSLEATWSPRTPPRGPCWCWP
jgi:hypothetical protein